MIVSYALRAVLVVRRLFSLSLAPIAMLENVRAISESICRNSAPTLLVRSVGKRFGIEPTWVGLAFTQLSSSALVAITDPADFPFGR